MTDKQKEIVKTISDKIIPALTEQQGERFLSYGEGMVSMAWQLGCVPPTAQQPGARAGC